MPSAELRAADGANHAAIATTTGRSDRASARSVHPRQERPMRTDWTHANATRVPGIVSGADDVLQSHVTADGYLVTCPDCHSLAAIEALPDDASHRDGDTIAA